MCQSVTVDLRDRQEQLHRPRDDDGLVYLLPFAELELPLQVSELRVLQHGNYVFICLEALVHLYHVRGVDLLLYPALAEQLFFLTLV